MSIGAELIITLNFIMYLHHSWKKRRHPGNWLPSLSGHKRRKAAKNDVKLQKAAKNKKNRLNGMYNFLVAVVIEIFSRYDIHTYITHVDLQL